MQEIYTRFKRPPKKYEKVDTTTLTELHGYVPPKIQIQRMILAGFKLQESRAEMFTYPEGVDPEEAKLNPTIKKTFDFAEARRLDLELSERIRAKRAEIDAKRKPKPPEPPIEIPPAAVAQQEPKQ